MPQSTFGGANANLSSYNPNQVPFGSTYNPNWSYQSPYSQPGQFGSGTYQPSASFDNGGGSPAAPSAPATSGMGGGSGINPVGFGLGAVQTLMAARELKKLSKTPVPEYTASVGMKQAAQRAQQNSMFGYTPSQAAAFRGNLGMALNTQFLNQRNMAGGNLAGALGARGTAMRLQSTNQFAANDADRQMSNIRYADDQTAGLQRIQNMNTEAAIRRRLMTEQALGAAIKQGTENMANSYDTGKAFSMFAKAAGGGM